MRAEEIKGLMEAYSHVYEITEVLSEEVVEEDVEQLMERGAPTDPKAKAAYDANVAKNRAALGNTLLYGNAAGKKPEAPITRNRNTRGGGVIKPPAASAAKPAPAPAAKPTTPAAKPTAAAKPTPTSSSGSSSSPALRPAKAVPATKPAASTPAAKPMSAMDQWAKANPKLAQAQKIRKEGGSRAEVNKVLYNKGTAAAEKTPTVVKAGVDIFDLVKGYLLDEGYAETEENAIVMMANMSEEWRNSILEAKEARENPEKHEEENEKENEKKYGKVRGEKTPMPPRGDKRREDFEKWYAKNVR